MDHHLKSLNKIQSLYKAEDGLDGRSKHMKGKSGEHLVIKVPNGTIFKRPDGQEIVVLDRKISKFIAARGGVGGKGNHYYLTNENRKPMEFELGHEGQEVSLNLELKLLADAAFVSCSPPQCSLNFRPFHLVPPKDWTAQCRKVVAPSRFNAC